MQDPKREFEDVIYLRILIGVVILTLVGLSLVSLGGFSLEFLAISFLLVALCWMLFRCRKGVQWDFSWGEFSWPQIGIFLILIVAWILWSRPSEYIFGGWDPGVYINYGVLLARSGSMDWNHELFSTLAPDQQPLFYHVRNGLKQIYPGFVIADPQSGKFIPYFMPSYPIWVAIFYSLFGIGGVFYTTVFISIIGLWGIYSIAKELMGRIGALGASILALFNVGMVWFSGFPNGEALSRLFLLGAVYSLIRWVKIRAPLFSLFSILGLICLGLALSVKFTPFVLVPVLAFYLLVGVSHISVPKRFLWLGTAGGMAVACLRLFHGGTAPEHTSHNLRTVSRILGRLATLVGDHAFEWILVGAVILCAIFLGLILRKRVTGETLISVVILLGVTVLAFFQSIGFHPSLFVHPQTPSMELSWYLSWPGMIGSLVGAWFLALRGKRNVKSLLIFLYAASFFTNAVAPWIEPFHFWGGRRLTEILLPLGFIFLGFSICELWKVKRLGRLASLTFFLLVFIPALRTTKPIFLKNDYAGATNILKNIAEALPKDGVVVAGEGWSILATPLYMIYGREVLLFSKTDDVSAERFLRTLRSLIQKGHSVYYLTDTPPGFTGAVEFKLLKHMQFETRRFDQTKGGLPAADHIWNPKLYIYHVNPYHFDPLKKMDKVHVDIGASPFGLKGFSSIRKYFPREGTVSHYRYVSAKSSVQVSWSRIFVPKVLKLFAGMRDPRQKAQLMVYCDGRALGKVQITGDFALYEIPLSAGMRANVGRREIQLVPMEVPGLSKEEQDQRLIKLDWLEIV